MNILHLYGEYFPLLGGIENYMRVLAEAQVAHGHTVRALCCGHGPRPSVGTLGGVTVERTGCWIRVRGMPLGAAYGRRLRALRPDVVHLHTPFALGEYNAPTLPPTVPIVTTFHCEPVHELFLPRLYRRIHGRMLARASAIIVTSEALARQTPALAPHEAKWRVVPIGTDTSVFRPDGSRPDDPAPLLFVGKPRVYKGLDDLMRALARLPGVRLDIVGEGPQTPQVRAWAEASGVADRVRFLGELANGDLAARYRGASLVVLPSNCRTETFGIVLIEAMACGCACLTTEVGTGTSWVVQDGVTGRVVPPCRPDRLAAALGEMLADPARLRQMGAAGRERVARLFTQEAMVAGVEQVYRACVGA
jgi:rhamnosyl/mannosyltransferase